MAFGKRKGFGQLISIYINKRLIPPMWWDQPLIIDYWNLIIVRMECLRSLHVFTYFDCKGFSAVFVHDLDG